MRKLTSHMQLTLDGFVCGPNGELDWSGEYHDEAMWNDVFEVMSTVDTVLFGRVTYQLFEAYWPAAPSNPSSTSWEIEFSRWIEKTAKVVVSRTLDRTEWKNTTLLNGDILESVSNLKAQTGNDILIFGSPSLTTTLMNARLIDELRTNVHPIVLGEGKPYFPGLKDVRPLTLVGAKKINEGVVGLRYEAS